MSERLDHLMERLAAAPADRPLDRLEAEISHGIGLRRAQARTAAALAPVGFASIALALATGVTVGGVTAAIGASSSAFSASADLAPSTLLEGGR
ncbi:MAG: hypothetical protein IV099_06270 [Phenylobacterium sp.]|uniref:hypothetical protein n=1 Tax=Phenylobacterium sp. TaxID=1871053 RepID=UPI0025D6FAC6|nr:hypothetical protein [Phenylobacterium sp.]MBT9470773.1 hypothetical protein [Phenylobacterium sp.]